MRHKRVKNFHKMTSVKIDFENKNNFIESTIENDQMYFASDKSKKSLEDLYIASTVCKQEIDGIKKVLR